VIALGAAVIVVVAVLALILVGFVPLPRSIGGTSSTSLAYSQAAPEAGSAASGYHAGNWTPVVAVGENSATTVTEPFGTAIPIPRCTLNLLSESPMTLPAYSGSVNTGVAPFWLFAYAQGKVSSGLIVLVVNGVASPFATYTGTCLESLAGGDYNVTAKVIDSTTAAAAAQSDAATFLGSHTSLTGSLILIGGPFPVWDVDYSTCSLTAVGGTGAEFTATVDAATGAVVSSSTNDAVNCS
jgi:hypothetical protein